LNDPHTPRGQPRRRTSITPIPSPAMTVAVVALIVALGGTSYAVTRLPANSVGTTQLKSNAVVASKVKDGSLLKRDFAIGQLPAGQQGPPGYQGAAGPQGAGSAGAGWLQRLWFPDLRRGGIRQSGENTKRWIRPVSFRTEADRRRRPRHVRRGRGAVRQQHGPVCLRHNARRMGSLCRQHVDYCRHVQGLRCVRASRSGRVERQGWRLPVQEVGGLEALDARRR
jgi:hypothetical protein